MSEPIALIPALEAELSRFTLDSFEHNDAWRLGVLLTELAIERDHAVTIDVRRPHQILFHHSRPGTTADNDAWVERKARTAFRYEESSWLVRQRFLARGVAFEDASGLDPQQYASYGGAIPVRVKGAGVVAVVTVSGLSQLADHELVVEGLTALTATD
jgi:uncharacterized protein (UPF0303 family)